MTQIPMYRLEEDDQEWRVRLKDSKNFGEANEWCVRYCYDNFYWQEEEVEDDLDRFYWSYGRHTGQFDTTFETFVFTNENMAIQFRLMGF